LASWELQIEKARTQGAGPFTNPLGTVTSQVATLTVQPAGATPSVNILSGMTVQGVLQSGSQHRYYFEATAGGSIVAAMGTVTGTSFYPHVQVCGPDGQYVGGDWDLNGAGVTLTAAQSGTHYLVLREYGDDASGTYNVSLATFPAVQVVSAIIANAQSGETIEESLQVGGMHVVPISVNVGDRLIATMGRLDTAIYPVIELYRPNGSYQTGHIHHDVAAINVVAEQSGTHYLVLRESGNDAGGRYRFTLAVLPGLQVPSVEMTGIQSGEARQGTLVRSRFEIVPLDLPLGIRLIATMSELDTALYPMIELYRPNGSYQIGDSGYSVAGINALITAEGTHYLVLRDSGNDSAGRYTLSLTEGESVSYSITASSSPAAGGGVALSPLPNAEGKLAAGTKITFTATPAAGYYLKSWSGVDGHNGSTAWVTLLNNRTVTASFAQLAPHEDCGCPVEYLHHCTDPVTIASVKEQKARLTGKPAIQGGPAALDLTLIRRFRDEVLATTPEGRAIIDTFYGNAPELISHFVLDTELQAAAIDAIVGLQPTMTELLAGGEGTAISSNQVANVEALVTKLESMVGAELKTAIGEQLARVGELETLVGLAPSEARQAVIGLPFEITAATFDAEGRFGFRITGETTGTLKVQYTEDMVTWEDLELEAIQQLPADVTDDRPRAPVQRFYRVVLEP